MNDPEIVLAPCREAGLISEEDGLWLPWASEVTVPDVGSIDVLLISSEGRVGIVETKLAYNHEARRKVVAQVLEYAINLNSITELPIPTTDGGNSFVDREVVRNGLQEGDYLLVIAGDQLDSRAIKLSEAALGKHSLRAWALALVEVAVFEQQTDSGQKAYLLVPHIRGTIVPVHRQVVTIQIQGDKTRVDVTPATPAATGEKWDEERIFAKAEKLAEPLRQFANDLRRLRDDLPNVTLAPGRGASPTLTLRKGEQGILTFYLNGSGSLGFNKHVFSSVLGEEWGEYYRRKLEVLFPEEMGKDNPYVKLHPKTADRDLVALSALLQKVLTRSPRAGALAQPEAAE
jgi:hypothetical protein